MKGKNKMQETSGNGSKESRMRKRGGAIRKKEKEKFDKHKL